MTTAQEARQTGFDKKADLKVEQLAMLARALDSREYAKAEYERADIDFLSLAEQLPNGIYRIGKWRIVLDTEVKTKVRVTVPKRGA